MRIGGVSVGKVKEIQLAPADQRVNGKDTTEAVIEIEPEFAPISDDARAILRQKTLLGETYVELTSGTEPGEQAAPVSLGARGERLRRRGRGGRVGRGGRHARRRPDRGGDPDRRDLQRPRRGDADLVPALAGERGDRDRRPRPRPQRLARQPRARSSPTPRTWSTSSSARRRRSRAWSATPGATFEALTERDQELAGVIVGSNNTFDALASEDEALAETFQILPTFQRESRLTLRAPRRVPGQHAGRWSRT